MTMFFNQRLQSQGVLLLKSMAEAKQLQNGDKFINHHLIVFGQSQNNMGASQGNPDNPQFKATGGNLVVSVDSNCHNVSTLFPFKM